MNLMRGLFRLTAVASVLLGLLAAVWGDNGGVWTISFLRTFATAASIVWGLYFAGFYVAMGFFETRIADPEGRVKKAACILAALLVASLLLTAIGKTYRSWAGKRRAGLEARFDREDDDGMEKGRRTSPATRRPVSTTDDEVDELDEAVSLKPGKTASPVKTKG